MDCSFKCTSINRKSQSTPFLGTRGTAQGGYGGGELRSDLIAKDLAHAARHKMLDVRHRGNRREQVGHADDGVLRQPARNDAIPVGHVRVDIQRKAVAGDAARIDFDADGGDLGGLLAVLRAAAGAAGEQVGLYPDAS